MTLKFEFEPAETSECDCCGKTTTRLIRWVFEDNEPFAMYYAAFSSGHPENGVIGVVSFGEWWADGHIPDSRVALAFQLWVGEGHINVAVTDTDESPWAHAKLIGKKLTREEALKSPWKKDLFRITDQMLSDDTQIREFFETTN